MVCACIEKVQSLCLRLKMASRRRGRGGRANNRGAMEISDPYDFKHIPLDMPEGIYQDEPQSVRDTNLLVNRRIGALREKGTSRTSSFIVVDADSSYHQHRRPSSSTYLAPNTPGARSISLSIPLSPSSTNTLNISNNNLQHKRITRYRSTGSLRAATPLALGTANRSPTFNSSMSTATLPTYLSPSPPPTAQSQQQRPMTSSCYYLNGYSNRSTNNLIIGRPRSRSRISASRVPTLSSGANASMTSVNTSSSPPLSFYGYRATPSSANGGRGLACSNPGGMLALSESRPSVSRSFAAIDDITAATSAAALANARSGSMSTSITTSSTLSSFVDAEGRKVFPL